MTSVIKKEVLEQMRTGEIAHTPKTISTFAQTDTILGFYQFNNTDLATQIGYSTIFKTAQSDINNEKYRRCPSIPKKIIPISQQNQTSHMIHLTMDYLFYNSLKTSNLGENPFYKYIVLKSLYDEFSRLNDNIGIFVGVQEDELIHNLSQRLRLQNKEYENGTLEYLIRATQFPFEKPIFLSTYTNQHGNIISLNELPMIKAFEYTSPNRPPAKPVFTVYKAFGGNKKEDPLNFNKPQTEIDNPILPLDDQNPKQKKRMDDTLDEVDSVLGANKEDKGSLGWGNNTGNVDKKDPDPILEDMIKAAKSPDRPTIRNL